MIIDTTGCSLFAVIIKHSDQTTITTLTIFIIRFTHWVVSSDVPIHAGVFLDVNVERFGMFHPFHGPILVNGLDPALLLLLLLLLLRVVITASWHIVHAFAAGTSQMMMMMMMMRRRTVFVCFHSINALEDQHKPTPTAKAKATASENEVGVGYPFPRSKWTKKAKTICHVLKTETKRNERRRREKG